MGEGRGAYRALVENPEGNRLLGRPRRRWEDNIKMGLREVGREMDWIETETLCINDQIYGQSN
jgi:hypothetical protein